MTATMNLHSLVEQLLEDSLAEADIELNDLTKTAGVEPEESEDGAVTVSDLEKVAADVESLIQEIQATPAEELVTKIKESAKKVTPGTGHLKVHESKDGKQNYETGSAKTQVQEHPLQSDHGHPSKTVMHTNDPEMKAFLAQTQPQISGKSKKASAQAELRNRILHKVGGVASVKPNISGTELKGPDGVTAAGEGATAKGKGANLVSSVDKCINLTKGQAKKLVKPELATILREKALSKATDPVLHNNWRNTSKAGVKIASVDRDKLAEGLESAKTSKETTDE